jgi:hypothetical protein
MIFMIFSTQQDRGAAMTEPQVIELWPCGYTARCSAPECRRRTTTILRYLDSQGRPDHQADACDSHASEISAALNVIDRRRHSGLSSS